MATLYTTPVSLGFMEAELEAEFVLTLTREELIDLRAAIRCYDSEAGYPALGALAEDLNDPQDGQR